MLGMFGIDYSCLQWLCDHKYLLSQLSDIVVAMKHFNKEILLCRLEPESLLTHTFSQSVDIFTGTPTPLETLW